MQPIQDPGSTENTAYNLGNLTGIQEITEFVGSTDGKDIYKFTLTETSSISIKVDNYTSGYKGLGAYLYVDKDNDGVIDEDEYLYDDDYNTLNIDSTLGAADYFLSINSRSDTTNTNYDLTLSATPNPPSIESDPGSTENTSYNLGYFNLGTSEENINLTEFVGSTDEQDIYKFSLAQNSSISIKVDNYTSGYKGLGAYLYVDQDGDGVIDEDEYLYSDDYNTLNIDSTLGAADYFLSINSRSDTTNTNYDLSIQSTANPINSIITLEALDNEASENASDTGIVRIIRQGDTSQAQTVTYDIVTGNQQARNGVDYTELSGSVVIPEDRYYVDLVVAPIDDEHDEIVEQVNITLTGVDNEGVIGIEKTARVTIEDNDEPDNLPYVSNPIADVAVDENAANHTINLSNVFADTDGDEITLAVKTNSNSQLISASINGTDLTLDFADDLYGTSDITIEATANSEKVSDTFSVTVNEVIDEPQMSMTTVHRFFQYQQGYHLYTSYINEINHIKAKSATKELAYNYEAEQYQVLADNKDTLTGEEIEGVKPIYRFFNTSTGAHLYTMSENEKNSIQDNLPHFNYEGITYYAYESEPENLETIPVYRMFNNNSGAHLYSTNQDEINSVQDTLPHFSMENNGDAVFHVFEL